MYPLPPREVADKTPQLPKTILKWETVSNAKDATIQFKFTSFTANGSDTQLNVMSAASTTSDGVGACWAPASTNFRHLVAVRFQMVTWCPELIRFLTMPDPMMPSPRKPNFKSLGSMFFFFKVSETLDMSISSTSGLVTVAGRFSSCEAALCLKYPTRSNKNAE